MRGYCEIPEHHEIYSSHLFADCQPVRVVERPGQG